MARWVKDGKRVIYVVCTNGDKGTSDINMKPERLAAIRKEEQQVPLKFWESAMLFSWVCPIRGLMRIVESTSENSVWTWRWTNWVMARGI